MIKKRDFYKVIKQLVQEIPSCELDLITALEYALNNDIMYKAPEDMVQWYKMSDMLRLHIPNPTNDWEFKVLSIFTTKTIDELKDYKKENE